MGVIVEGIPTAGAADVIRFAAIADGRCPQPAGNNAFPFAVVVGIEGKRGSLSLIGDGVVAGDPAAKQIINFQQIPVILLLVEDDLLQLASAAGRDLIELQLECPLKAPGR